MKMNKIVLPEPPNVLKSIKNGFDATTKHLVLLVFPVGLDLFLWFAPHLQIKSLIEGFIMEMSDVATLFPAEFSEVMESGQEVWKVAADRLNLFIAMRSFPVGIFSLLTSMLPTENPLGVPLFWDIPTLGGAFLLTVGLYLVGLALAGIYYSGVRQSALFDDVNWRTTMRNWPRIFGQVLLLSIICLGFFSVILIFGSCAATGITLISVPLGQIVIILFGVVTFWMIFPLFFSPHGIFSGGLNAWKSLLTSVRLTNITFLRTSFFVFLAILINQGLNMIWQVPPEDSWLMLISIVGHAFVMTGMLSASFVYYQDMVRWVEELREIGTRNQTMEERPTIDQ
jgi:hypothetical protein